MSYSQDGTWSGLPKFVCDLCPFDSVREDKMVEHVDKAHRRERAPRVNILGPNGAPIESMPVTDSPAETHEPRPRWGSAVSLETLVEEQRRADAAAASDGDETVAEVELKVLGGGWYELPDGQKVHGQDKAIAALAEVHASTPDIT